VRYRDLLGRYGARHSQRVAECDPGRPQPRGGDGASREELRRPSGRGWRQRNLFWMALAAAQFETGRLLLDVRDRARSCASDHRGRRRRRSLARGRRRGHGEAESAGPRAS